MKIVDQHIMLWEATTEFHQMQVRLCVQQQEAKYAALCEAASSALSKMREYKKLLEASQTEPLER